MVSSNFQVSLWKILIVLETINYQIVTILFNDFFAFKFLRDVMLIIILMIIILKGKIKIDFTLVSLIVFCLFVLFAVLKTKSLSVSLTFIRKYLSPMLFFIAIINTKPIDENKFKSISKFLLNYFCIFSIWGIFQAYILGPSFLIDMGYPTKYSNAYKAIVLRDSYYFGNLGIQRVVGTLSNSNVCALILGTLIIFFCINYKKLITKKSDVIKLIIILMAYLLTFSRANILAMIIVAIILAWKYIPKKVYLALVVMAGICGFFLMYMIQDDNGITHKLWGWVVNSLTFKESSASARTGIWEDSFWKVIENPFGYGFGKVGAYAQNNSVKEFFIAENSYLAIALDLGIMGLLSYLIYVVSIAKKIFKKRKRNTYARAIICIIAYTGIAWMFSNHIYDREAIMMISFYIGILILMNNNGEVQNEGISNSLLL